jgi:signal transduction histidine kinase
LDSKCRIDRKGSDDLRENQELAVMGASAAVLAHEMSNQLNVISFAAQMMEQHITKQNGEDETVRMLVPGLKRGLDQLGSLLNEFRSLGQPQRLNLQSTSVVSLVTELLKSVQTQYDMQGIHIELELPAHLCQIPIDRQKFKQALLNLCKNAVEAMPGGGTLIVRIYRSRRTVFIEVQDSGVGIPEGVDIFEPFVTTKSQGSGLGMAVVRQVIAAHGGAITYTSQKGRGTTFRLSLPISRDSRKSLIFGLPKTTATHHQRRIVR